MQEPEATHLGRFQVTATSPTCAAVHAESARMTKRAVCASPFERVMGPPFVVLLTVPSDCRTCTADDDSASRGGSSATPMMTIWGPRKRPSHQQRDAMHTKAVSQLSSHIEANQFDAKVQSHQWGRKNAGASASQLTWMHWTFFCSALHRYCSGVDSTCHAAQRLQPSIWHWRKAAYLTQRKRLNPEPHGLRGSQVQVL